jgi:formylglycine-generating enzyme required for sulfatase activity
MRRSTLVALAILAASATGCANGTINDPVACPGGRCGDPPDSTFEDAPFDATDDATDDTTDDVTLDAADDATSDDGIDAPADGATDVPADAPDALAETDVTSGDADATDVSVDGGVDAALPACPSARGSAMVRVTAGAASFCIDRFEATNEDYQAFLQANVPIDGQPAVCASNDSYTPTAWTYDATKAQLPAANMDWCDAVAFCKWAGKRLCGKIGGGPNPVAAHADPTSSEWLAACSAQGANTWPYGSTYVRETCNTKTSGPAPVGSLASCVSAAGPIHDLSGNVYEFEDSCVGPNPTDNCFIRGGHWNNGDDPGPNGVPVSACAGRATRARNVGNATTGIRCCAD